MQSTFEEHQPEKFESLIDVEASGSNADYVESDDHLGRVQEELDTMNYTNESINTLELQLDDSKREFSEAQVESEQRLAILESKLGICVSKARPFYESKAITLDAKEKYLKSKHRFETAQELYVAARRLQIFAEESCDKSRTVSEQYQMRKMHDMAKLKVIDAEVEKQSADIEQIAAYRVYANEDQQLEKLSKSLKRVIDKSKAYYDLKEELEKELHFLSGKVKGLKECLYEAKSMYHQSMKNLETISTEIHTRRNANHKHPGVTRPLDEVSRIDSIVTEAISDPIDNKQTQLTYTSFASTSSNNLVNKITSSLSNEAESITPDQEDIDYDKYFATTSEAL